MVEPQQQFGEYTLLRKIAAGGMAEIYEAEIRGIGGFRRRVAVKRILPQLSDDERFIEMMLDEARIAARLVHPGIVQVLNCGQIEGSYFIAMEYIDGQPLSRLLRSLARDGRRLSVEQSIYVTVQLLRALAYAHEASGEDGQPLEIVHRDVSPQNLLVSYDGEVKLLDFGIASAADKMSRTETGAVKGKIAYMAPEQMGAEKIDHRLDQYAAALVLFECLVGERAYAGPSELHVMRAVFESRIDGFADRLRAVLDDDHRIHAALTRALSKDRHDRYPSCRAFADELAPFLKGADVDEMKASLAGLLDERVPRWLPEDQSGPGLLSRRPSGEAASPSPQEGAAEDDRTVRLHISAVPRDTSETGATAAALGEEPRAATRSAALLYGVLSAIVLAGGVAGAYAVITPSSATSALAPPVSAELAPPAAEPPASAPPPSPAPSPKVEVVAVQALEADPQPAPKPRQPRARKKGQAIAAPSAAKASAEPQAQGSLTIGCLPWCQIRIDGKPLSKASPLIDHPLPAGRYLVEVLNPPTGQKAQRHVRVTAGQRAKLSFRLE